MSTTVQVNTHTYATAHVATNLILSLKLLIVGCGLNLSKLVGDWVALESGVNTWIGSRHLKKLVLEIYSPTEEDVLITRFDFSIDYAYNPNGDGVLWIDMETVKYALHKVGAVPSDCLYDIIAQTEPDAPQVEGWSYTYFRSTAHLKRRSVGATIGGENLGTYLNYWTGNN